MSNRIDYLRNIFVLPLDNQLQFVIFREYLLANSNCIRELPLQYSQFLPQHLILFLEGIQNGAELAIERENAVERADLIIHNRIAVCGFVFAELSLELIHYFGEWIIRTGLHPLEHLLCSHSLLDLGQPFVVRTDHKFKYSNQANSVSQNYMKKYQHCR